MHSLLVAEGDRDLREAHAKLLALQGFRVHSAHGGVDCLEKLRHVHPDVLLLDCELPWGGGDGVLDAMREEPLLQRIPVVLTSAVCSLDKLKTLAAPPVVGVLTKPFGLHEVRAALDEITRTRDSQDVAACLEREIRQGACGRVQGLQVDYSDGAALVTGRVSTYHAKQLVLAAAMKFAADRNIQVHFAVDVTYHDAPTSSYRERASQG